MSNSSQVDEISSIAGEPANNSPLKSVPPLDGRNVNGQLEDNGLTGMELHLWSPQTLQDEWLIW